MPEKAPLSPPTLPPATPVLRSHQADDILKRLAVRRSDYHWMTNNRAVLNPGRHLDQSDTRHQNAVVDAVAATEVFVGERLRVVDRAVTEDDVFTWAKREKAWRGKAAVELSDAGPTWTRLNGYVQIRNAIQHGMGRLTDFQIGKWRSDNLAFIKATGCPVDGDVVRLRRRDVESCFDVCEGFILWLDTTAATAPSGHVASP